MIYALFNLGVFVKFYLNFDQNDKNFVQNLLRPLSLNQSDIQIIGYRVAMRNDQSFFFEEDKSLVFTGIFKEEVEVEPGKTEMKNIIKPVETFHGEVIFPKE